ncbi:hypothetical protein M413DRAFT_72451 [Hebeloma cylindrosporum]|uniref:F-box domain-containing protein n=1 Tax=Hebeloma cylindrosporum TaxID=76867 RepID=A0A0C2XTI1_HEBCY|nr:hypothetical protein M413DRAFT_72451 [Hebeloma cylindrosporum h7]
MEFSRLPPEIVEEILVYCDPIDVAQVAATCSAMRDIIYGSEDSKLWRELYLAQPFDDPRDCVSQGGQPRPHPIPWKSELQRIIRARIVVCSENPWSILKSGELVDILNTFLDMVCYVPPRTLNDSIEELSSNLLWVAAMLRLGFIDLLEASTLVTEGEQQLTARLHTYYGLTKVDGKRMARVKSRAYVYDMRNYHPDNKYGPFLSDGGVDWVHMQALHHVVSMHMVSLMEDEEFEFAVFPLSLPYTQIVIPREVPDEEKDDWAGVNGVWAVSFCFCDHRDLLRFNEGNATTLDTSIFEEEDFREVCRSLNVTLSVRRIEPDPEHPSRPILHFFGEMHQPSTSTMTGTVRMTPDNEVEWKFVSGDEGDAIWSSIGVQVGGLRSSFGILGAWTTIFHEGGDPVGE